MLRPPPARRAQIAPITAISLFGFSMSMSYPLVSLSLERMEAGATIIGLNAAGAALAMVIGAPVLPMVLQRAGIVRLMLIATLAMAAVMIAFPVWPEIWYWALLRIAYGFAGTALFFASEYWIVGAAPERSRGRVVAIYAIAVSSSFMLGPLTLRLTGSEGALPWVLASAVILAGAAPILWGRDSAPPPEPDSAPSVRTTMQFFVSDPTVVWGVVLFGAVEYGTLALLPVWSLRVGLGEDDAVLLLALFAFGSIVFQWPIGWLADRADRRALMALGGAVSAIAPLAMLWWSPTLLFLAVAVTVWGAFAVSLYTLALTELGARYRGTRLSEANAAVVTAYGVGALFSPALYGWAMDLSDPHGLLWACALSALSYLGLALLRMTRSTANSP